MPNKRLYLAAVNNRYGQNVFLPLVAGLLWGYARSQPGIAAAWTVPPGGLLYLKEPTDKALSRIEDPDLVVFSSYIWNHAWNRALARAVKARYPQCLTLVGGIEVRAGSGEALRTSPEFDLAIYGEGEGALADLLGALVGGGELQAGLRAVPSLIWRRSDGEVVVNPRRAEVPIESIPSPYLDGLFDGLTDGAWRWQSLQETNRGCIAAGAMITTPRGPVAIESVRPGDQVLGWNELDNVAIWNTVEASVTRGVRSVLRLSTDGGFVDATDDHPIFTQRGWIAAGDLQVGDCLRCLRKATAEEGAGPVLFPQVLAMASHGIPAGASGHSPTGQASESVQGLRRSDPASLQANHLFAAVRRRGQEGLAGPEAGDPDASLRGVRIGDNEKARADQPPPHLLARLRQGGDPQLEARRAQSHETSRNSQQGFAVHPRAARRNLPAHEETMGGSSAARSAAESIARGEPAPPQLFRVQGACFHQRQRAALSLHGRLSILGRPLRIGLLQKSRLRTRVATNPPTSNPGAWTLLAPRSSEGVGGDRGLPKSRMGVPDHLGRRATKPGAGGEDKTVWRRLIDKRRLGEVPTYDLANAAPYPNFFANGILVHNCPYTCTFCAWGNASLSKLRRFPEERIVAEYEWMATHGVDLLYNCDANYGILPRDVELTEALIRTKERHGRPVQFRAAFAKNSNDLIFELSRRLAGAGMLKATTLALQSMDDGVLTLIKRKNIKQQKLAELSARYEAAGIPTYAEIIVGLPGETLAGFVQGLEALLDLGQHDGVTIYLCMLLENTEMASEESRRLHGLESAQMRAILYHGTPEPGAVEEIQETVIGTRTMPRAELRQAVLYSWLLQALHALGLTQNLARALRAQGTPYGVFYKDLLRWAQEAPQTVLGQELGRLAAAWDQAVSGGPWDLIDPRFGEIMWPPEELLFLRLSCRARDFYAELRAHLAMPAGEAALDLGLAIDAQEAAFCPPAPGEEESYAREAVWYGRKGPGAKLRRRGG